MLAKQLKDALDGIDHEQLEKLSICPCDH